MMMRLMAQRQGMVSLAHFHLDTAERGKIRAAVINRT
jgi:hypothetical protein